MNKILFIILASIAFSCDQTQSDAQGKIEKESQSDYKPNPESIELNKKALEITMFHRDVLIKVDSAILLLNKATEIDSLYFLGYANKIQFLLIKQDFPRLLETNERIRELRPKQPNWIIQRALILELSGEIDEANTEYKKGIIEYEEIMDSEKNLSWEFELEFAQSLVMANNYDKALEIINRLKKENPDLEIWEAFELQTKDELLRLMNQKRP
jgi:tetratricopeptide (TPR) repeat protein